MVEENQIIERNPLKVLGLLLLAILVGWILGSVIMLLIGYLSGWEELGAIPTLTKESTAGDRNQIRFALLATHLCMFILPALAVSYITYKPFTTSKLNLNESPKFNNIVLGVIILLFSMPLVQFSFWLNQQIPLPDWMILIEDDTNEMIANLLIADAPYEFLFNLLIVAIVPAIGEELIFRGLIQRNIAKISNNAHTGIWFAAFLFSAIHFQFQGFIPRALLGVMLGYLFYWSANLWIPIIAHFFYNGIQLVAQHLFYKDISEFDIDSIESVPVYVALISLGLVVGVAYIIRKNNKGHFLDEPLK